MAAGSAFKQQCPSCEAMITIKADKIGKKVECTKCKDKFIAEPPEEEVEKPGKKTVKTSTKPATTVAGKPPAASKRSKVEETEGDDIVEPELEEAETPRKSKNGKP